MNICLYNGPQPYQGPIKLLEPYEHPELAKQYFLKGYYLVDLRNDNVAKINQEKQTTLAELALRQFRSLQGFLRLAG